MLDLELAAEAATHLDGTVERAAMAAPHLSGPAGVLQGGIATGALLRAARAVDGFGAPTTAVDARLHAPTPVGTPVATRVQSITAATYDVAVVADGTTLVSGTVELAGHDPAPRVADLLDLARVPLPTPVPERLAPDCWVCGVDNDRGLHLYPARLPDGRVVQGWVPPAELADERGMLDELAVCAVLDCPTVFASSHHLATLGMRAALLAGFHVRFFARAPVMEPLRIVAQLDSADGRKLSARSALIDEEGTVYAVASAFQFGVEAMPGT